MNKRSLLIFVVLFTMLLNAGCISLNKSKKVNVTDEIDGINNEDVTVEEKFKQWKKKLYSKDTNIQTAAAVSLLNLESTDALELLKEILKDGKNKGITISVLKAFGFTGDDRAMSHIISILDSKHENIRLIAAETLGKIRSSKAHKMLISNLFNSQKSINSRILIVQALGDVRNRDSVDPLIKVLKSNDENLQIAAHNALVKITMQHIGKDVAQWEEWWDLNKIKSREEWLEDIIEELDENVKQAQFEGEVLNKEIAKKSIELLKSSLNNSDIDPFIQAVKSNYAAVRVFAANELSLRKPPEALNIFLELLLDENLEVRIIAVRTLGGMNDERAIEPLLSIVSEADEDLQVEVVRSLGRIGRPQAVDALIPLLNNKSNKVLRATVEALSQIVDARVTDNIIPLFENKDPTVRESVALALGKIKDEKSVEPLIKALFDKDERVRWYAADSLGKLKSEEAVAPLIVLLSDSSARVRESATTSLGQIGNDLAVEHLIKMLDDPDKRVVEEASDALIAIAGGSLKALDNLSKIFFSKKDYNRAIQMTEKQLASFTEKEDALWESRVRLAQSYLMTENWDKAAGLYTILVDHFPNDIELKKELLRSMLEMKQHDRSLELISEWINGPYKDKEFFWKSRLEIIAIIFGNEDYVKVKELIDKFEAENPELGGKELKSDFISLRKKSLGSENK